MIGSVLAMEMLQGVWKQHLRPRAVVGYGVLQITSPDHLDDIRIRFGRRLALN